MKDSTFSLMYSRNASLLHRPMRRRITVEIPARNMAMAPPERIECSPMSSLLKPSIDSPMSSTVARSHGRTCAELISEVDPSDAQKEQSLVSGDAFGIVDRMR